MASNTAPDTKGAGFTPCRALEIGRNIGREHRAVAVASAAGNGCAVIRDAIASGLTSAGCSVLDAGAVPLPAAICASDAVDCTVYVSGASEESVSVLGKDGSPASIRHDRREAAEEPLPDYKGVGRIRRADDAVRRYVSKIAAAFPERADAPVILDCGCGCTSVCGPALLAEMGADVTSVNAHQGAPRISSEIGKEDAATLRSMIGRDRGSIGVAFNGDGTKLALVDEGGGFVDPEYVLALIMLYVRPSKVVVPVNASAVVDDAFHGLIGEGVSTRPMFGGEKRRTIRSKDTLASVTETLLESGADLGVLRDGTLILPRASMCPDAMNEAAILTRMSAENSIRNLLASFPRYAVLSDRMHHAGNREMFSRKLVDRLSAIEGADVSSIDGWRVDMGGGWFSVAWGKNDRECIDISAESRDKAYAVSMMEFAKSIVRDAM
ncbi:MAG: hypothetical protein LBT41_04730 [Candidatus Methanoplasma sp.]|jgi:phosphoglucosamine mutase|nr:hypothetical protein [Candidatus Methanoplasma sp.]